MEWEEISEFRSTAEREAVIQIHDKAGLQEFT